jgi:para-nitrobenzyl esterase
VIVTFNYRLGAMGFFSHPELTKESDGRGAGNLGLMDSIAAFGGDPRLVTIFGESAGAGRVANLQASPRAKGLFGRELGESSAEHGTIGRLNTLADAEAAGVRLADSLGAKSLAELRAKPAAEVMRGRGGAGLIVDGWWVPEEPSLVFNSSRQNGVAVLAGSNRDESFGTAPKDLAGYVENAKRKYGDQAALYLRAYPASTDEHAKDAAFFSGRDEMAFVMRNWARLQAQVPTNRKKSDPAKTKAYVYLFTHQPPQVPGAKAGGLFGPTVHGSATHTTELAYVFDVPGRSPWTEVDHQLSDAMGSYWVNFATHGDPNGKGLPLWPVYDGATHKAVMLFGDKTEAEAAPRNDAQLAFFQAYYDTLTAR